MCLNLLFRMMSVNALGLLVLMSSFSATAYGELGHRIIANGAYYYAADQTKQAIDVILSEQSIGDASVWPDQMKSTGVCAVNLIKKAVITADQNPTTFTLEQASAWLPQQLTHPQCDQQYTEELLQAVMAILVAPNTLQRQALQNQYIQQRQDYLFWQISKTWHYVNVPPTENYQQSQKAPSGDLISAIETFSAMLSEQGVTHPLISQALDDYIAYLMTTLNIDDPSMLKRRYALSFLVHLIADLHQPLHAGFKKDLGGNRINVLWFGEKANLHQVWDDLLLKRQNKTPEQFAQFIQQINSTTQQLYVESTLSDWLAEVLLLRHKAYAIHDYQGQLQQPYFEQHLQLFNQQLQKGAVRLAAVLDQVLRSTKTSSATEVWLNKPSSRPFD